MKPGPSQEDKQRVARVFIASPVDKLIDHRQSVLNAVDLLNNFKTLAMERFGAATDDPVTYCNKNIALSDIVVVIVGSGYGSIAPGTTKSFTHLEVDSARSSKKPIIAFLERPLPGQGVGDRRVESLRRELLRESVVDFFSSPDELSTRVVAALHNWFFHTKGFSRAGFQPLPPQPRIIHPYPLDSHFVGRSKQRRELSDWLDDGKEQAYVLEAMGGMGKSALAWYWMQFDVLGLSPSSGASASGRVSFSPRQPLDGVFWWSFYEMGARFPQFVSQCIRYLQGRYEVEPDGDASRVDMLISLLRGGRYLIVLDGLSEKCAATRPGIVPSTVTVHPLVISERRDSASIPTLRTFCGNSSPCPVWLRECS